VGRADPPSRAGPPVLVGGDKDRPGVPAGPHPADAAGDGEEGKMSEKPIVCKDWEVRAILAGRKTQMRRVIRPQPEYDQEVGRYWWRGDWDTCGGPRAGVRTHGRYGTGEPTWTLEEIVEHCPHGRPGDMLWVRETWQQIGDYPICYAAGPSGCGNCHAHAWRSSVTMPRRTSRLSLRIIDVRVQRLREISEEDACAEGVERFGRIGRLGKKYGMVIVLFADLWDSTNAKPVRIGDSVRLDSWEANPWVWAISFERATP